MIGMLAAPIAKWLIVGAVIAGLSGALYWQIRSSGRLTAERDQAISVANENAKEVERQKGYAEAASAAVIAKDAAVKAEQLKSDEFQRRLRNVATNCNLDPALAGIVTERLWGANPGTNKAEPAK